MTYSKKFSVIVPTMWKYEPFVDFAKDLLRCDQVGELILINNDVNKTPQAFLDYLRFFPSPKLKYHGYDHNIGVNPAWNLGVQVSYYNNICIVNDDVIFDFRVFEKVNDLFENVPDVGIVGLNPGKSEFNQRPHTSGRIEFEEWKQDMHTYGFGCLMFLEKKNYIRIPDEIKIYYGDNWLFDLQLANKRKNYFINDLLFSTPFAQTTGTVENANEILRTEGEIYHREISAYKQKVFAEVVLNREFEQACNTPSDINEHLSVLKRYADCCESVTEFGVRSGVSTRAILASNATKIRLYDLYKDPVVDGVVAVAKTINKDVAYLIGDTLKIEIDKTDLLFIDTDHSYEQLSKELSRHGSKVNKYIAFHDVETYGKELLPAILEFLQENAAWYIEYYSRKNNGFLVLAN